MTPRYTLVLLIGAVVAVGQSFAQGDCWWTGCQPGDWAVVGCDHYGREERGTKPCQDGRGVAGFKYNCCAKSGGGGDGGEGEEYGDEDDAQADDSFQGDDSYNDDIYNDGNDGDREARSCMENEQFGCSDGGPFCCSGFCCRWPGQSRGVCKQPGDCNL